MMKYSAATSASSPCMVCGSIDVTLIEPREGLRYVRCNSCKHCAIDKNPKELSALFYESQAKYYGESSTLLVSSPSPFESEMVAQRIDMLSKYLRDPCDVVEVGPGAGHVLRWLKANGHFVTAFEHSPMLANQLTEQLGMSVINSEFEESEISPNICDAFCSFHVIEHTRDPFAHLSQAFSLVRPGGFAFVATPNSGSWQQLFFESLSPNFDSAHLWVFSTRSLQILSEKAGWEIIASVTPERTVGWLRVLTKGVRRIRREDEERTAGKYAVSSSRSIHLICRFLQAITMPLRFLQSKLGYGNEVFLVLRKPAPCLTVNS